MPWNDRSGAFSPLRGGALALAALPALYILAQAVTGGLGPRPLTSALHQTGDWSVRLLLLTLLVSPLRRLLNWPKLILARQIFGLGAFAYALAHLILFIADQKFDLWKVTSEIAMRFYLGVGFVALTGLAILTRQSGAAAVKRLGAEAWTNLHKLVYPIAVLSIFHFFLQTRLVVSQPVLMAGFFYWLMGYRAFQKRGWDRPAGMVALAIAASAATLATELAWYGLATNVRVSRIFNANFAFDYEIRMMWWVLGAALALAAAGAAMAWWRPARRAGR